MARVEGMSMAEARSYLQEPAYNDYELYCLDEAVLARMLARETARLEAPQDNLEINPDTGSITGSWAGTIGDMDMDVVARFEAAQERARVKALEVAGPPDTKSEEVDG